MKKDLPKGQISREAFQQWLNTGTAPLTVESGSGSLVTVLKLSKTPEIDYLYGTSAKRTEGVSWGSSLQFCGAYDRKSHMLCLPDRPLVNIVEGLTAEEQENGGLAQEISDRVNRRVEETIANDRNNLSVKEIINRRTLLDLEYYREYGAKEEAIQYLFGDQKPDGQFHSDYHLAGLAEAEFIAWLQDPEAFVKAEAGQYIERRQEAILLAFLKNDALLAEYQALVQDAGSPIHRMKAITDAVRLCGGKTVTVTVRKDDVELTFKTSASSLTGHKDPYSTYDIPAADRREFERVFGRYASYTAEDITAVTYCRRTIYEAPLDQREAQDLSLKMGGM